MILMPPSPEALKTCDLFDQAIGEVIAARGKVRSDFGRFEAPFEARIQLNLTIRYAEGIIGLARSDLVLLPSAIVLARSAFDTSVRICWLLLPNEPFAREARWLIHLQEEERLWDRMARISEENGGRTEQFRATMQQIQGFRTAVAAKLPAEIVVPRRIPSVADALKEQGLASYYLEYAMLSQYVHGGHYAGGLYRKGLGTQKQHLEDISLADWALAIRIAWWSLYRATDRFVQVAAHDGVVVGTPSLLEDLEDSISALEHSTATGRQEMEP